MMLAIAGLIVTIVILVIGLAIYSATARQTQSFRDGYSAGGAVYASDNVAQRNPEEACRATENRGAPHGGLPIGDNPQQWLKGCIEAFNAAQSGT